MSGDDVSEDGMTNHELTDQQLEALLEGSSGSPLSDHPVAAFLDDARTAFRAVDPPEPTSALAEFVGVGRSDPLIDRVSVVPVLDSTAIQVELVETAAVPRRRTRMIPALTAFIGTTVGKIAIGGSVAFAATAGAHATGVVDVPGLPDTATSIVDSIDDSSIDDGSTSTTNAPTTTTLAGIANDSVSSDSSPSTTTGPTSSSSSSSSSSTSVVVVAQGATIVVPVTNAGDVEVKLDAGGPVLISSNPAAGWSTATDGPDEPGEIDLIFTNGANRIDFTLEYEDGFARARIRDRASDSETFLWYSLEDGSLLSTTTGDNSGSGSGSGSDDSSGSGSGSDDSSRSGSDDSSDDSSGSGSGSDDSSRSGSDDSDSDSSGSDD